MIETIGLGAGSYPEPPEDKIVPFEVTCVCSFETKITVYAENIEEAMEKVQNGDYDSDDREVGNLLEIEDIKECEEC